MARPFVAQRHLDLVGRVERKFDRLAKHVEGEAAADYLKLKKACTSVANYIKSGKFGEGVSYMTKIGERLIVELPTTYETLQNQAALKKAKSKSAKKAA